MKPLIIGLLAMGLLCGAASPKKPQKEENPISKIEAAVRAKVPAHFKSKDRFVGSAGVKVISVSVKIERTEPMAGWEGRWKTTGTAELMLGGRVGADKKQTRSFTAYSEVSGNGGVKVEVQ